ncbi:MAG: hypothetical protein R3350_03350 [Saprospiraceae bacterium]|nr:hypothetical protein [Saprospiraceae bacterium]
MKIVDIKYLKLLPALLLAALITLTACQQDSPVIVTPEEAEELTALTLEMWNENNPDLAEQIFSESFKRQSPTGTQTTFEELDSVLNDMHTSYPYL